MRPSAIRRRVHLHSGGAAALDPPAEVRGCGVGTFYTPASLSRAYSTGVHGHRIPFVASLPAAVPSPRDLERQWATSLATEFEMHPGVFYRFAAERMRIRYLGAKPGTPQRLPPIATRASSWI